MRHSPPRSRGCYGRLIMRGPSLIDSDDDEGVMETSHGLFSESQPNGANMDATAQGENSGSQNGYVPKQQQRNMNYLSPVTFTKGNKKEKFLSCSRCVCVFILTNVFMSILLLVVGIAASVGPGIYSLLFHEPTPAIDKSIKAFNIPNHIVSRRQDALEVAKADMRKNSRNRGKRDTSSQVDDNALYHSSENHFPSYHELVGRDMVGPLKSYLLSFTEPNIKVLDSSDKEPKARLVQRSVLRDHIKEKVSEFYDEQESILNSEQNEILHKRFRRGVPSDHRIYGITQGYRKWKMQVVYLAEEKIEPNVFTKEKLQHIHKVETAIKEHEGFVKHCYISYYKWKKDKNLDRYNGCAPLNSLMTYFYPSTVGDHIVYDGLGRTLNPIDKTLMLAMTQDTFFWYVDDKINATYKKSKLLRTEVQFGAPLEGNLLKYSKHDKGEF